MSLSIVAVFSSRACESQDRELTEAIAVIEVRQVQHFLDKGALVMQMIDVVPTALKMASGTRNFEVVRLRGKEGAVMNGEFSGV